MADSQSVWQVTVIRKFAKFAVHSFSIGVITCQSARFKLVRFDALPKAVRTLSLIAVAMLTSGCGESHPETFPVTGQVVFKDGSTLPSGGWVEFFRTEGSPQVKATGTFGSDGKFVLSTFGKDDGAIAGDYKVAVSPVIPDDRKTGMSQADYVKLLKPIAPNFMNPESSGLQYTVSAETSPHDFRIEVTPPRRGRRR